ncbi:MAG TPA: hypothetical protein H9915_04675 [Candidatus Gemmiger faecigallinarum]|nr:hypothetical protein [Candidatus Gemmiger faecigallinarum]
MAEWSVQIAGLGAGEQAILGYSARLKAISRNISSIETALHRQCSGIRLGSQLGRCAANLSGCSGNAADLAAGLNEISQNYRSVENRLSGVGQGAGQEKPNPDSASSDSGAVEVSWWEALCDVFDWKSLVSKLGPLAALIPTSFSMFDGSNPFQTAKYINSMLGGVVKALDKWDDADAVWASLFGLDKADLSKMTMGKQLGKIVSPSKASDYFSTFGAILTLGGEVLDNYNEFMDGDGEMGIGRMLGETAVESAYNIGKGIAGTAAAAGIISLLGGAPAIVVAAAGVGVVWIAESGIKAIFNIEGPLDEVVSDWFCDTAQDVGEWVGDRVDEFKDAASDAADWVGDRLNDAADWAGDRLDDAADWAQNTWKNVTDGVSSTWDTILSW